MKPTTLMLTALILIGPARFADSAFGRAAQRAKAQYVCPMHPDVRSGRPGKCARCGMTLRRATANDTAPIPDAVPKSNNDEVSGSSLQIPDTPVYDQDGRRLRFYSDLVKGKTVAINFIFTTCTTICPPLTATFRKVQQELNDRVGRDVTLISISVDPITDVPERLKPFAAKFGAGPGWSFITGNKQDIDALLKALGAFVSDKNDHTAVVLVGNDQARYWTRAYGLARPSTLVNMIREAATKRPNSIEKPGAAGSLTLNSHGPTNYGCTNLAAVRSSRGQSYGPRTCSG